MFECLMVCFIGTFTFGASDWNYLLCVCFDVISCGSNSELDFGLFDMFGFCFLVCCFYGWIWLVDFNYVLYLFIVYFWFAFIWFGLYSLFPALGLIFKFVLCVYILVVCWWFVWVYMVALWLISWVSIDGLLLMICFAGVGCFGRLFLGWDLLHLLLGCLDLHVGGFYFHLELLMLFCYNCLCGLIVLGF